MPVRIASEVFSVAATESNISEARFDRMSVLLHAITEVCPVARDRGFMPSRGSQCLAVGRLSQ